VPLEPLTGRPTAVADDLRRMHGHLLVVAAVLVAVEAVGLATDSQGITRVQPDWPQIYPYTVAGLAAILGAMALFRLGGRGAAWAARALAGVTLLLGAGVEIGVSAGLLPSSDPTNPDGTTWVAALPSVATMAVALSVLLIGLGGDTTARLRFWLAAGGGMVSLLGLLSYLYGSAALFTGLGVTGISLPTTVIALVVVGAALTATPDRPPLASLDQRYDRSLLRRIVPLLVLAPLLPAAVAWVILRIEPNQQSAVAISGLVTVVVLVAVIALVGGAASRAQRELRTQRNRVWDAFENSPAPTAILSIDGRIAIANAALAAVIQRPVGELTGAQVADLVMGPDDAWVAEAIAHVGAGHAGFRREVRLNGRGREGIWIDLGVASVRDSDDSVGYLVLQCIDLTDRKRLDRGLADQATPSAAHGTSAGMPAPD
jgi:PAS domain S-box-containing protein